MVSSQLVNLMSILSYVMAMIIAGFIAYDIRLYAIRGCEPNIILKHARTLLLHPLV